MKVFDSGDGNGLQASAARRLYDVVMRLADPRAGRVRSWQARDGTTQANKVEAGRVAVVVHLSRLRPPAPRPHHRRIARALLQDTADRHDGQLFALGNGDLVLVCRHGDGVAADSRAMRVLSLKRTSVAAPAMLPSVMGRLLRADCGHGAELVSLWPLATELELLLAYARARLAEAGLPPLGDFDANVQEDLAAQTARARALVEALVGVPGSALLEGLLRRQTAIVLTEGGGPPGRQLQPLFREVTFSFAALEAQVDGAAMGGTGLASGERVAGDPNLSGYLAGRVDELVLNLLNREFGRGGRLDVACGHEGAGQPVTHVTLTPSSVMSPGFSRLAKICAESGVRIGVHFSLLDAVADHALFDRARGVLATFGCALVLDGVSHLAVLMSRPWLLRPDLLKLRWSPDLAELDRADQLGIATAIGELGPQRVVLYRAETEVALRWGLAQDIRRFQGRHVDTMLAASRIVDCAHSGGCTLGQCMQRAASTGVDDDGACFNQPLLNAVIPGWRSPALVA